MSKIPGPDIIAEILNGNEKVLASVYKKVYLHLENYGKAVKASDYIVKEAVQDAFEVFYRQILNGKLNLTCSAETYVISIAKRLLHKIEHELGFFNKDPLNEIDLIDEIELENDFEEQKHSLFTKEFKTLSSDCRRILTLTLEGYNAEQIKTQMNFSSENLLRLKRRKCKYKLIQKIKENPDYEKLRNANPEDFELPLWRDE